MGLFGRRDIKNYLLLSSRSFLGIVRASSGIRILPSVTVYPTGSCNYRCGMCEHANGRSVRSGVMDFALMKRLIEECSSFAFKPVIHFSGHGEPLIYPGIKETMRLCRDRKMKWSMTTNGYLLGKHAADLIENNCHAINVSIHGSPGEHDKITGVSGAYEKVAENVGKLLELKRNAGKNNPLVALNSVISGENVMNLRKNLETFVGMGVNSVTFQHLIFSRGDLRGDGSLVISGKRELDELAEFTGYIRSREFRCKVHVFPPIRPADVPAYYRGEDQRFKNSCVLPWLTVRIYPDGSVGVCKRVFGNLQERSLKDLLNSAEARSFRDAVRKGTFRSEDCFRCCHRHYY